MAAVKVTVAMSSGRQKTARYRNHARNKFMVGKRRGRTKRESKVFPKAEYEGQWVVG